MMKRKTAIWMLLLATIVAASGCGLPGAAEPVAPAADHPEPLTLIPYTSHALGLTGLVPSGWVEFTPGHFQPAMPSTAPTLFAQLGLPGVTLEQVVELATLPESTGSVDTQGLTWDLYAWQFEVPGNEEAIAMEIALAGSADGVSAVVLGALAEDHGTLREQLFLPAIEALAPVEGTGGDVGEPPQAAEIVPLTPGPEPLDTRVRAADGMTMVYVPGGEFRMGADAVWRWSGSFLDGTLGLMALTDQRPAHTVHLDAYWIDRTEVTVAMFRTFVEATGYETMAERQGWGQPYKPGAEEVEFPRVAGADWQHPRGPGSEAQDDHPVVQVSWDDAAAYCAWAGGALPTEAQWEKACRGTGARAYPWGDAFEDRRLNYCAGECPVTRWGELPAFEDGYPYTAPVGSFPAGASPYGALDMAGNVWEWTADRYDSRYYARSPDDNPQGPMSGAERVQHGGAWYDAGGSGWLACTIRHATVPANRADDLGFRCAVPAGDLIAFTHVNLVPMTSEQVVPDQTVVVEGSTIVAIGDAHAVRVPAAARVVDGAGAYLMPGLIDMHVHTRQDWEDREIWPVHPLHLYLANGVTAIRDLDPTGSPITYALRWRDEIRAGTRDGPAIYASGTLLYKSPLGDAEAIVRENHDRGFDFLKIYSYLSARDYHAAMAAARTLDMYTTGHIPYAVGLDDVLAAGMDEIAHVEELLFEFLDYDRDRELAPEEWLAYLVDTAQRQWELSPGELPAGFEAKNRDELAHIASELIAANVAVCTTMDIDGVIQMKLLQPDLFLARPENRYQEAGYLERFTRGEEKHQLQFRGREQLAVQKYGIDRWILGGLHDAGVLLLLGTDSGTGGMGIVPGFSVHDELRILVDHGFTPYEAIATGTVNAAIVLERMTGQGNVGTIEEGNRADLLLVAGNPLEDVTTIRNPIGVMAAGRWYPQAMLSRMLEAGD